MNSATTPEGHSYELKSDPEGSDHSPLSVAQHGYFPARANIDLGALRHNVGTLHGYAPQSQLMAIVKANAYGHGLLPCAWAALAGGANWLGVAQVSEALALRSAGIAAPILTWLYGPDVPFVDLIEADIDVSVSSLTALHGIVTAARKLGRPARIHVKFDTGLGRNGVSPVLWPEFIAAVSAASSEGAIVVIGAWSHLTFGDVPGHPETREQCDQLDRAVSALERAGVHPQLRHMAATSALVTDSRTHYDLVRPGIGIYGISPVPSHRSAADLGLWPVMSLEAQFANVKPVSAAQGVSYGHGYATVTDSVLGVVPIGYADGIPRHASGVSGVQGAPVLVAGANSRVVSVAGRICMDQFVVDLGPGALEQEGGRVVLFGNPARGEPSVEDWADSAGTISYELTTRLGPRVPRNYIDASEPVAEHAISELSASQATQDQSGVGD